jgi:hypothetical protein
VGRAAVAQVIHLGFRLSITPIPNSYNESSPEPDVDTHHQISHASTGRDSKLRRRMSRSDFSGHRYRIGRATGLHRFNFDSTPQRTGKCLPLIIGARSTPIESVRQRCRIDLGNACDGRRFLELRCVDSRSDAMRVAAWHMMIMATIRVCLGWNSSNEEYRA